jgi:Holliday junction DNA helicase RuvA
VAPFLLPEQSRAAPGTAKADGLQEDILSALVNLGYPKPAAEKAIAEVVRSAEGERTFEELLRRTLRRLAG